VNFLGSFQNIAMTSVVMWHCGRWILRVGRVTRG
jgi:hypothetical protein